MDLDIDHLDKQLMTVQQVAEKLLTNKVIVYGMIDSHELPAYKFGKSFLVHTIDLDKFTQTHMMDYYRAGKTGRRKNNGKKI